MKRKYIRSAAVTAIGLLLAVAYLLSGIPSIYVAYVAGSFWVALPFIYGGTAPDWWRSPTGRALMMLLGSLAALFVLIVSTSIFGAYEGRELVRFLVYGGVLVAAVRLAALLFQLRLKADWSDGKGRK